MSRRKPTKKDCRGCYNDVYNHGCGGAEECWLLKSATLEKRLLIPVDLMPPYNRKAIQLVPSCYKNQRYVTVDPEKSLDERGYWK